MSGREVYVWMGVVCMCVCVCFMYACDVIVCECGHICCYEM